MEAPAFVKAGQVAIFVIMIIITTNIVNIIIQVRSNVIIINISDIISLILNPHISDDQDLEMSCAFELEGENLYSIKWFQVIRNIVGDCPTQLTVDNWICSMTNTSEIYERTQQGNLLRIY